jgi:hypothetical protein
MEAKVTELEDGLKKQLESLTEQIRSGESNLMLLKEGYLKVQGALEVIEILKKEKEDLEVVSEALA